MSQPSSTPRYSWSAVSTIAIATGLTRIAGLVREQISAAAFGAGTVYGAFQYAGLIPSFFLVIVGGLNGPLHSAMVTVLAGRSPSQQRTVIQSITVTVGLLLAAVSVGLYGFAPQCIDLVAPGLAPASEARSLAILQLKVMAPVVWLGGMAGISIGILTSAKRYGLPTLSPLLSSLSMSAGVLLWMVLGHQSTRAAARVLAIAYLGGAMLQWLVLWLAQRPVYWPRLKMVWPWQHPDIKTALGLIASSILFTSMVQANWYIDVAFASLLPNPGVAVSTLTFAHLLAQAPMGILVNSLLIPLLPHIAQLAATDTQHELRRSIVSSLQRILRWGLPTSMLLAALARPIVATVYQRGAFDATDTALVADVIMVYAIGLCFVLARDLLIRVLYVLKAHRLLVTISLWGLGFNLLFNTLLYKFLGVTGLVLSTSMVNLLLLVWMLVKLHHRLGTLISRHHVLLGLKSLTGHAIVGVLIWTVQTYWISTTGLLQTLSILSVFTIFGYAISLLFLKA